MTKIGIITFTDGDNYGQRLQNLAVQEIVKGLGFEPYTIRQYKSFRKRIKILKQYINSILNRTWLSTYKRHNAFKEFDDAYINYFNKSISEKSAACFPEQLFTYFIAGSDQIWSPYSDDVNSTMFLRFTSEYKRISLAPSIASDEIPYELQSTYKEYLKGFRCLSIRERKGAQLIFDIAGREAEVLIDPTLMFSSAFWEKYERKPVWLEESEYLLFYFLGSRTSHESMDTLQSQYGCSIIDLLVDRRYRTSGPSEFLYLIHHAKLVVTDSYHGSVFSLIFGVPFMIKQRQGSSINMSSRFDTLAEKFHLRVSGDETINSDDFGKLILAERQKEMDYLKTALGINDENKPT